MTVISRNDVAEKALQTRYQALLDGRPGDTQAWLGEQLHQAAQLNDDLPDEPGQLPAWAAAMPPRSPRPTSTTSNNAAWARHGAISPTAPRRCGFCSR